MKPNHELHTNGPSHHASHAHATQCCRSKQVSYLPYPQWSILARAPSLDLVLG